MDAVVLAAGRGERLSSLVPPFRKPLIEVNGVPLVRTAVELAIGAGVEQPVVVAAPINAADVDAALSGLPACIVIQRQPHGPGDALRVGLQVHDRSLGCYRVLVLLSDNVITHNDVREVMKHEVAIGVRSTPRANANRFTWFDPTLHDWREKVTITDGEPVDCWVGPFIGWRSRMERVMQEVCDDARRRDGEALIGPYLGLMTNHQYTPRVPVSAVDVGTPEAFAEMRGWK